LANAAISLIKLDGAIKYGMTVVKKIGYSLQNGVTDDVEENRLFAVH
jgi:hypothetical protein